MIAQWIARSGLPVRTVEDDAFIHMIESIDKRLAVPKKTKINNLVDQLYDDEKQKFRKQLTKVRKITLGLDIWTKRGLTASFLAISACYFCPQEEKAKHILLTLVQLSHPHTAECIKTCVDRCTEEWGIPKNKILTVITDNGSNMVTAFKKSEEYDDHSTTEEDSQEDSEEDSDDVEVEDQRFGAIERMPCVVHTLQLVVNIVHKEASVKRLIDRVRLLVRLFRKSSVATEQLLQLSGLTLIKDCPTR
ncbi:uncharacterized protein LOC130561312 [Triplophysa rosa]|uniref:uncharacterized protein LOC130561312 n=1 Tax=Triplophysa rosa TaxID=992332 RepID=UPI002545D3D3|nr:uncharacterized protein LOC130561312 [Triplophysa rosa]